MSQTLLAGTTSAAVNTSGGAGLRPNLTANESNPPPSGGTAADFAAAAKAQGETYDNDVYLDADLITERNLVKGIVSRSDARWVAVQDGDWSNTATWYDTTDLDQTVPDVIGATVLIPQGVTVTYDVTSGSEVNLKWIRVDGTLTFDTTVDTVIKAETVIVDHTATFNIGSSGSPLPEARTVTWTPYNTGDMDTTEDPAKFGRGFICYDGAVNIYGPEKVPFARATATVASGATTITLDQAVTGVSGKMDWQTGDEIVITGTRLGNIENNANTRTNFESDGGWDTEVRTISNIDTITNGAANPIITLSSALSKAHLVHPDNSAYTCHVANLTRNITFGAAGGASANAWHRPHFLCKGAGGINVVGMAFENCGRTDDEPDRTVFLAKGYAANDTDRDGTKPFSVQAWNAPDFLKARTVAFDGATTDFSLWKNGNWKVEGVNSGARGILVNVTNSGGGVGSLVIKPDPDHPGSLPATFQDNEVIRTVDGPGRYGSATVNGSPTALTTTAKTNFAGRYGGVHVHRCGFDDPSQPAVLVRNCTAKGSTGWTFVHHDSHADFIDNVAYDFFNVGFAIEGGGNIGKNWGNFATSQTTVPEFMTTTDAKNGGTPRAGYGAAFWSNSRSVQFKDCVASNCSIGFLWNTRAKLSTNNVYPGAIDIPRIFYGLEQSPVNVVNKQFAPIVQFDDCESYAVLYGASVSKNGPIQNHSARSTWESFVAWECWEGIRNDYTGHYSIKSPVLTGLSAGRTREPTSSATAITFGANSVDMVALSPTITRFSRGFEFRFGSNPSFAARCGFLVVNPTFASVGRQYSQLPAAGDAAISTFPYSYLGTYTDLDVLTLGELGTSTAGSATWDWQTYEDECVWADVNEAFGIIGDVTDSTGSHPRWWGVVNSGKFPNAVNPFVQAQVDLSDMNQATSALSAGAGVALSNKQMFALMQSEGVYSGTATNPNEKILLIPDYIEDRVSGEPTLWHHPVALRIPTANFNNVFAAIGIDTWANSAKDNGTLSTVGGVDFSAFQPAGIPGLT